MPSSHATACSPDSSGHGPSRRTCAWFADGVARLVEAIAPPIPLEILVYGARATLALAAPAELREVAPSPDGGLIADYLGPVDDPYALAERLAAVPGVVEHGLFPPELVSEILIGRGGEVERRTV